MNIHRQIKVPYILSFLLTCVSIWLLTKIHLFYVPNSDFMNYLNVGRRMFINPMDPVITSAPLYPVIIWIFEILVPIESPGVIIGIVFNIICFIATLYVMWMLIRRVMSQHALIPVVLFAVNPLSLYVVLQPSNLPLAVLFVFLAILTHKHKPIYSFSMLFLGSITRIEVLVLFAIIMLHDLFILRKNRCPKGLLILFILLFAWYARPVMPHDNYVSEISHRLIELPNLAFIRNSVLRAPFSINLLTSHKIFDYTSPESFLVLMLLFWLFIGARIYKKESPEYSTMTNSFMLSYGLIHLLFPDRTIRYSFPLLPFVYVFLFLPFRGVFRFRKTDYTGIMRYAVIFIACGIAVLSFTHGSTYTNDQRWDRAERRLVSEWLNTYIRSPSVVYAFEPYVHRYYNKNNNIQYHTTHDQSAWKNELCMEKRDVYIIFDNQTTSSGSYYDHINGLDYFLAMQQSTEAMKQLKIVHSIKAGHRYANVYRFINTSEGWCGNFFK